jgi:hypothetical protein
MNWEEEIHNLEFFLKDYGFTEEAIEKVKSEVRISKKRLNSI